MAVTYTQELLDRAEAWTRQPLAEKRSAAGLIRLAALYSAITGTAAGSCRQCQYSDYNAVVQAYVRQASAHLYPETVSKTQYSLAPGFENETFVHEAYDQAVTAATLTDADAEFFIKNGFGHAFLKDGKPIPQKTEAEAAGDGAPKLKKADYQARYEELHGEKPDEKLTIAQLIEANDAKQADLDAQRD
ncbi:hypothetical protein [Hymenobacter sp. B81]|uniref:hypothetical protein n=1 Tax=Hymenobacter sp. B81 TaxID=3344878 RepID=UPI0037DD17B2